MNTGIFLDFLVVFEGLIFRRIILDQNDLIIRIVGILKNGLYTSIQIIRMVLGRDQDRYQRLLGPVIMGSVDTVEIGDLCLSRNAHSLIVIINRPLTIHESIVLTLGIAGSRFHMDSPMIENQRNMIDSLCIFDAAEGEFIVLRTVIIRIQESNLIYQ